MFYGNVGHHWGKNPVAVLESGEGHDGGLWSQAKLGGQMRVSGFNRPKLPQGLTGGQASRQQGGN